MTTPPDTINIPPQGGVCLFNGLAHYTTVPWVHFIREDWGHIYYTQHFPYNMEEDC